MGLLDELLEKARARKARIVLPEGEDARVRAAAERLAAEGLAVPILLPDREPSAEDIERYATVVAATRDRVTESMAARLMKKPLYRAGAMVAAGDADAMVAGAAVPTRRVIEAAAMTIGPAAGIETVSSYFLMLHPDFQGQGARAFLFADCAVNADPSAAELADIALASAESAAALLPEAPRVAFLSFSTKGSAEHPHVRKVREAYEITREKEPELTIDGELQADSALVPAVAAKKTDGLSPVAGKANVLIFPDLNSGNIAYKLTQYMGGVQALGPFLQGFAKPVCDLSRGASVDDIVLAAAIASAQAS